MVNIGPLLLFTFVNWFYVKPYSLTKPAVISDRHVLILYFEGYKYYVEVPPFCFEIYNNKIFMLLNLLSHSSFLGKKAVQNGIIFFHGPP